MSSLRDTFRGSIVFIPMVMLVCEDSSAPQNSWLATGFCDYTDTDYSNGATVFIGLQCPSQK